MVEASIPVDVCNPGQVFACLGFFEASHVLLGHADGGFDWSNEANVRFVLSADGDMNPFEVVLDFLAHVEIQRFAPHGYSEAGKHDGADELDAPQHQDLSETFPDKEGDRMALPILLKSCGRSPIALGHWADGSSRERFKLYSGNRSACGIAHAMLRGTRGKPTKKQQEGKVETQGIDSLWSQQRDQVVRRPFDILTPMRGSFNFDPRGAWTALDAGYSPNTQKHGISASPIVEMLAAWGLEHARPQYNERVREVRYGVWSSLLPLALARPALSGVDVGVRLRRFCFVLALSGKNKVVTFAQEESQV